MIESTDGQIQTSPSLGISESLESMSLQEQPIPMCSYCYIELERKLCCSLCHKRQYCSKECQKSDWKQHKYWCNVAGELNVDFEIKDSSFGGKGVFALRNFECGDKVLVERVVIETPSTLSRNQDVQNKFERLPSSVQGAVMSLHPSSWDDDPSDVFATSLFGPVAVKFKYNSFGLEDDGSHESNSGLFINASRFNHSCLPNCLRYFALDQKVMIVSANKRIEAGTELTISYSSRMMGSGYENHRRMLQNDWHFSCSCEACRNPAIAKQLVKIERLDSQILTLGGSGQVDRAYAIGEQLLQIYDELELAPRIKGRTYYDMFQMAVVRKRTLPKAKQCIEKCLESWILTAGGSNRGEIEAIARFRDLAKHPENYYQYLSLER